MIPHVDRPAGGRRLSGGAVRSFVYEQLPGRVIFGAGMIERLAAEAERLGTSRALVLATPGQRRLAEDAARRLGPCAAGILAEAVMHVPIETARQAGREAKRLAADATVAIGGGSTIGLAKAIALELGLPIIAVPTTYSGSEMTPIYGLTEAGQKRTGRDRKVLPRTVIYDPVLTLGLPPRIAVPSGINAIAHSVEALYAEDANPVVSLMAEEGIRALAQSLPRVVARPDDVEARAEALYGAYLSGAALGAVGMALHHKLCHTLGGSFNLPHAETHAVILPHAVAYNRESAPAAMARVARALGAADAAMGLYDLGVSLGAPTSLRAIGMREVDLDRAADLSVMNPYYNPRAVARPGIRALLDDAFHGRAPAH